MQDKHDAAETFFEAATSLDPKNILAWTMLGTNLPLLAKHLFHMYVNLSDVTLMQIKL